MLLFSMYRRLSQNTPKSGNKPRSVRPSVETLEDRVVPATITITVNNLSDTNINGEINLRQALNEVNSTSSATFTIVFANSGTVLLSSQLELNPVAAGTVVNIKGAVGGDTISGQGTSRVLAVDDLTGVRTFLNLTNINISEGSVLGDGGGIYNKDGSVTLNNCSVANNTASSGSGGGLFAGGVLSLTNSTVSRNSASQSGGGSGGFGGGIYAGSKGVVLVNSSVTNNTLERSTESVPADGAGIFTMGAVNGSNSHVDFNTAAGSGGGIYASGSVTLSKSTVNGNFDNAGMNRPGHGGGIFTSGSVTLTNSSVSQNRIGYNTRNQSGGGIFASGNVSLANSSVSNNTAIVGGGIYASGSVSLSNHSSVNSNRAGFGIGGGIFASGSVNLSNNCSVSSNFAFFGGGGIYASGKVTLIHDTIAFNRAATPSGGAGVYASTGSITVQDTLAVQNLLFNSTTRQSFAGTGFTSKGHNITDDPTNDGFLTGPKDDFGGGFTGIVRGTLAFNQGGKTRTYALSAGSRAIGGGDLLAGFTRNQNGAAWSKGPSDIGSF
jgi:predicted outer membrane repeat protein